MDYPGLKDKVIFGMGGYGGNAILIDMENSRILVVNSLHYNNGKYKYNVKKLLIDPIKKTAQVTCAVFYWMTFKSTYLARSLEGFFLPPLIIALTLPLM